MKYLFFILFSFQLLAQSFEEQVLKYLQKEFSEYQKIEIQLQQNKFTDEKIVIDYTRSINMGKGFAFIPVITTKGKKTSPSVISIKVQLFKKLFVASKNYERRELLHIADFEEKILNVTNINGTPVKNDLNVLDYRAKTFIKKGEILFEENIEKIPLINSGDKVCAEVRNGNVLVTTEAIARQQGSTGDLIEFVSLGNKIFKARVINATKVVVE